jgi:cephalosporin hydroxylase
MWETKPSFVVETGVARGGSLIFSASMMSLIGVEPMVLGLDIQILEHAISAIRKSRFRESIELWEGDSASNEARDVVKKFLFDRTHPGLLVLDSEHSHKHVLAELNNLGTLLPIGSIILVADTLIEELPSGYFSDRPWDKGNSPLTAINEFLKEDRRFTRDIRWSRRSLVSEFRDGVLIKTS